MSTLYDPGVSGIEMGDWNRLILVLYFTAILVIHMSSLVIAVLLSIDYKKYPGCFQKVLFHLFPKIYETMSPYSYNVMQTYVCLLDALHSVIIMSPIDFII